MAEKEQHTTVSEQESNFLRFAYLVIRICPKAVRVLFDKCFQPYGLGILLNQIKSKLEALCKKRIINKSQMDILYPAQGTSQVKSTDFDVSLMLCLLRNIQNMHFPVVLPKPEEVTIENDLSRINYYRNFIAHDSTGELGRENFMQAWETLTKAVERLGGLDMKAECDNLLSIRLDSSFKEFYTSWVNHERRLNEQEQELKAVKSRVEELETKRDQYKENLYHNVEEWVEKDKLFFNTTAVTNIEKKVKGHSFVLISGVSGMGKSASAFHIALKWKKEQHYDIISIIEPRDIVTYASTGTNQIFIVDDFCGKFVTDEQQYKAWERLSVKLLAIFKKHQQTTRVIGTCRSNISCTKQVQNLVGLLSVEVCDLLDDQYFVNDAEKRNIALQYFDEESFNKIDKEVIQQENMFPLLCSLSEKTAFDSELFNTPYEKYQAEFTQILSENEACFLGLVLLVLNNNKLDIFEMSATPSEGFTEVFDKVWEDTDLDFIKEKPRKSTVLKRLRSIKGFLTRENGNIISTLHDKIFDFLAYFVCNTAPTCILQHGHIQLIQERVSLESQRNNDDISFIVYLPENLEHLFFDRMFAAFKILLFEPFFDNLLCDTTYYQQHIIDRIKKDNESLRIIVQNVWPLLVSGVLDNKLLHSFIVNEIKKFSRLPHKNFNPCILENNDVSGGKITEFLNEIRRGNGQRGIDTLLFCLAVNGRHLCCCDLLLNFSTTTRDFTLIYDNNDDENNDGFGCPLIEALKIIEEDGDTSYFNLLRPHISSTDINVPTYHSVLHWICNKCHNFTTLNTAINNLKFDVNVLDLSGRTPLYIACREDNECYVDVLIKHNCDVNIGDQDGVTPLMVACHNVNEDVVNTLLTSENCNPDMTDKLGNSALYRTARNNSVKIADLLIKHGALVNTQNNAIQSPLHVAAINGSTEMIQFLVQNSCNLDTADSSGKTPLMFSCITGNQEIVKLLLSQKCALNAEDSVGQTALHKAIILKNYTIAELLVETDSCIIDVRDVSGATPLYYSVKYGCVEIMPMLLSHCDVNISDRDGVTPLMIACDNNNEDIVNMFLALDNCNTELTDQHGNSALYITASNNSVKIADLLVKHGGSVNTHNNIKQTPLHLAAMNGSNEMVEFLVQCSCDLDTADSTGKTPLMLSCFTGNKEIVELLVNHKCALNVEDNEGQTALHKAITSNNYRIAELLVETDGCNIDVRDKTGLTPVYYSVKHCNFDIMRLLLNHNCEVNIGDDVGVTPLMFACQIENEEIVKILLASENCKPNLKDKFGGSALSRTAHNNSVKIADLLVKHGASVNTQNNENQSPLHIAAMSGCNEMIMFLVQNSCNVNIADSCGITPLMLSCQYRKIMCFKSLFNNGAKLDVSDLCGWGWMHYACFDGDNLEFFKLLVEHDKEALLNATDHHNQTPLIFACMTGKTKLVKLLLNRKCALNKQDTEGQTALHKSVISNNYKIVELLVETDGCYIDVRDVYGSTPLYYAYENGYSDILWLLLLHGADVNFKNKE